jgi:ABC-type Zn uptake system ZnuABC Zn-binding protein ZnuA
MKYALLLFAGLCFSILTYAQTSDTARKNNDLKIIVSNTGLSVLYRNTDVIVSSIQALDSCLKKIIQDSAHLNIFVESNSKTDPERVRASVNLLEHYKRPMAVRSVFVF